MAARVLLIEDDSAFGETTAALLCAEGFHCDIATDGAEGLELAEKEEHDILLLDLSLPDMDGFAVLAGLRASAIKTPVLILSGSAEPDDKITGLGYGADDYLTKPFERREFIARVQALLRRAKGYTTALKPAPLKSTLLARRGGAQAWSFADSYTPTADAPNPRRSAGEGARSLVRLLQSNLEREPEDGGSRAQPAERQPAPIEAPTSDGADGGTEILAAPRRPGCKVIVVGNVKGGSGKSTTAMHLIVALLCEGKTVGAIDLDAPQGTLSRYLANRRAFATDKRCELPMPEVAAIAPGPGERERFFAQLSRLSESCDYIVIDTPGVDTALSRSAHAEAEILITPLNDSFIDLDVLARVEPESHRLLGPSVYSEIVTEARDAKAAAGGGMKWFVVINRRANQESRNRQRLGDALDKLSSALGFETLSGLSERVIYRELFLFGLTLLDLGTAKGKAGARSAAAAAGIDLTLGHVAARQELRQLLALAVPEAAEGAARPKKKRRAAARA